MTTDFTIRRLGPARIDSPLGLGTRPGDELVDYVADAEGITGIITERMS